MGMVHKAETYTAKCDCCGAELPGRHMPSRPSGWAVLTLERAATDFQGAEVADASVRRLLCPECTPKVAAAINSVKADAAAPSIKASMGGGESVSADEKKETQTL